jgi:hypothetical protein
MSRPSVARSVALLLAVVAVLGVLTVPVTGAPGSANHGAATPLPARAAPVPSAHPAAPSAARGAAVRPEATQSLGGRVYQTSTTGVVDPLQESLVAADNATGTIFALSTDSPLLTAVNAYTGAIERSLTFANATGTWFGQGIAFDNVTGNLYLASESNAADSGVLTVLNGSTFTVVKTLPFSESWIPNFYPEQMFYWWQTNTLFVENGSTNDVMVLNASNNSFATWVYLPCVAATEYGYCQSNFAMFEVNVTGIPLLVVPEDSANAPGILIYADAANDVNSAGYSAAGANTYLGPGTYNWVTQTVYFWNGTDNGAVLYFDQAGTYEGNFTIADGYVYQMSTDPVTGWIDAAVYNYTGQGAQLTGIDPFGAVGWQVSNGTIDADGYVYNFVNIALANGTSYAVTSGSVTPSCFLVEIPNSGHTSPLVLRHYTSAGYLDDEIVPAADSATGEVYSVFEAPYQLVAQSESTGSVVWSDALPAAEYPYAITVDASDGIVYVDQELSGLGQLYAFSATTGALELNVSLGYHSYAVAAGEGHLLYVGDSSNSTVQVYNNSGTASTLTWKATIELPVDTDPCLLAASPVAEAVAAVACGLSSGVTIGTVAAGAPVAYYNATPVYWYTMAFNATGALYFGSAYGTDNVTVLSPGTFAFAQNYSFGFAPHWLGFLPQIHAIAVASDSYEGVNGSNVEVVSTTTGHSLGLFAPPTPLVAIATDPSSGALVGWLATTQLYVANLVALPSVVSGVALTSGNATLTASWTAATGASGYPVTGYNVFTGSSANGPWTAAGTVTGTTTPLTGLTDGTTYYVTVSATSGSGNGPTATPVSGVPAGVPYPPASVTAGATSGSTLAFTWTAPASDDGSAVSAYALLYSTGANGPWTTAGQGTSLSGTLTGLTSGTKYYVEVDATNAQGTGHPTPAVSATTSGSAPSKGALGGVSGNTLLLVAGLVVALVVILAIVGLVMMRKRKGGASTMLPPAAGGAPPAGASGGPGTPGTPPPPSS